MSMALLPFTASSFDSHSQQTFLGFFFASLMFQLFKFLFSDGPSAASISFRCQQQKVAKKPAAAINEAKADIFLWLFPHFPSMVFPFGRPPEEGPFCEPGRAGMGGGVSMCYFFWAIARTTDEERWRPFG
jgi:hypothetical protein